MGAWVAKQRLKKRHNKLSAEREAKLNAIGFNWGKSRSEKESDWGIRFNQLVEYKKTNGDCNNGRKMHSHNVKLGGWITIQRHLKKVNQMSEEREAKLDSIGFDWTARNCPPDWDLRF